MSKSSAKKLSKRAQIKLFKARSLASKRGWETRRQKQIAVSKQIVHNEKIIRGKTPNIGLKKRKSKKKGAALRKEVKQLQDKVRLLNAKLVAEIETKNFVPTSAPEFVRADGTIGIHPCRLRGLNDSDRMRKALVKAKRNSSRSFDELARDMAEFYDMPITEVYTLYYSP